jgi:hypothetical protein
MRRRRGSSARKRASQAARLRDRRDAGRRHARAADHGAGCGKPVVVADLMMFGPSDVDSPNSADLLRWRVKRFSNDELRQRFVDLTVAQAQAVNLTLPDPKLRYNAETKHWEFGEIDWAEFNQVISGNGLCTGTSIRATC